MNQRKLNNKGFSLVELIIVIAIMAVLIGLLAPQFLKYVQRSRYSTDVKNGQEIATVVQTLIADHKLKDSVASSAAVEFKSGKDVYTEAVNSNLLSEEIKSKVKTDQYFKVAYDVTNGHVEVAVNGCNVYPNITGEYATMLNK